MAPLMSRRSQRLVLTARDAGSAGHIAALAANAPLHGMDSLIVTEGAARAYFATRHIPHIAADEWLSAATAPVTAIDAIAVAGERLKHMGATAVVCGRSSQQDMSIDRIVIAAARLLDIPSFVVQDFWGDVWAEDFRPDHYFVIDEQAALLTRERTSATVHVIGSPKHAQYRHIDFRYLRQKGRAALGLALDIPTIGYFGQDLLNLPGYRQVLRDIGDSIARMGRVAVLYRPHPRETKTSCSQSLALLQESGIRPVVAKSLAIETTIATTDVVLSCFSTVGLDAAFMMCVNGAPSVSIICADYPDDVSDYWRPGTGLSTFPLVRDGIALSAHDRSSLEDALRTGLSPAEQERQAAACHGTFRDPGVSIDHAYELIARVVSSTSQKIGV